MESLFIFVKLLIITYVLAASKTIERLESRLIEGTIAPVGEFPYQASIRINQKHRCSGAIIDKQWILTSADCISLIDDEEAVVYVGTNMLNEGGTAYQSEKVILQPNYRRWSTKYNLGLIRLKENIKFGKYVSSIPLAEFFDKNSYANITGWGSDDEVDNDLKYKSEIVCDPVYCAVHYPNTDIQKDQICTGTPLQICKGDSGNPVVSDGLLIGIAFQHSNKCGSENYPDLYTNVATYYNWIKNVTKTKNFLHLTKKL